MTWTLTTLLFSVCFVGLLCSYGDCVCTGKCTKKLERQETHMNVGKLDFIMSKPSQMADSFSSGQLMAARILR